MKVGTREMYPINMDKLIKLIFYTCLAMISMLVLFDYLFNYLNVLDDRSIRRIWNVAREQSLPTWFSSMLAHLVGFTVLLIAWAEHPTNSRLKTAAWVLIGLFFIWIGIDDFAEIHEKLGGALVRKAETGDNSALTELMLKNPSFSWHVFIAPFFALIGVAILAFLWASFYRLRLLHYIVLGFGCWFISQCIDFIEGLDNVDDIYNWLQTSLVISRKYGVTHTFKAVEETLEMLGTTLLWVGFLKYFAQTANGLQFRLEAAVKPLPSEHTAKHGQRPRRS